MRRSVLGNEGISCSSLGQSVCSLTEGVLMGQGDGSYGEHQDLIFFFYVPSSGVLPQTWVFQAILISGSAEIQAGAAGLPSGCFACIAMGLFPCGVQLLGRDGMEHLQRKQCQCI